ncbi:hypothetical protein [Streptomyces variegatus]|uniref:hypothetical protein n=1 Tax=Streptomyces variegatus TaxID=284040 RepID=UPI003C2BA806
MAAPVKDTPNVGPVAEAVEATAWRRVASSEDPERFRSLVLDFTDREVNGRPHREPGYFETDGLLVAAHIEAVAGLRRLRARRHGAHCRCEGCRSLAVQTAREDSR